MSRGTGLALSISCLPAMALVFLVSCATGYQPQGLLGAGFSERRLGPEVWQVSFDASAFTPRDRVQAYLLLRCAELTAQNGAGYFAILAQGGPARKARATRPTLIDEPPFPIEGSAPDPGVRSLRSARAVIQIYREKPEEQVYDARALISQLRSRMQTEQH